MKLEKLLKEEEEEEEDEKEKEREKVLIFPYNYTIQKSFTHNIIVRIFVS